MVMRIIPDWMAILACIIAIVIVMVIRWNEAEMVATMLFNIACIIELTEVMDVLIDAPICVIACVTEMFMVVIDILTLVATLFIDVDTTVPMLAKPAVRADLAC